PGHGPLRPTHSYCTLLRSSRSHRALHSFPTRRSSDLRVATAAVALLTAIAGLVFLLYPRAKPNEPPPPPGRIGASLRLSDQIPEDRKSTRLNSSHVEISYAVFCLKYKTGRTPRSVSL